MTKPENTTRESLKRKLGAVIDVSYDKFHKTTKVAKERREWAKTMCMCISAWGKLLESQEIEDLITDVQKIKEKLNIE